MQSPRNFARFVDEVGAHLVADQELPAVGVDTGHAGIDPVGRMRVERDHAGGRLRYQGPDHWLCSLAWAARFAASSTSFVDRPTVTESDAP